MLATASVPPVEAPMAMTRSVVLIQVSLARVGSASAAFLSLGVKTLARAATRGAHDRMERSGDEFHSKVASAFSLFATEEWQRDHAECGPIVKVDGTGTAEDVHRRIVGALAQILPGEFGVSAEANAGK